MTETTVGTVSYAGITATPDTPALARALSVLSRTGQLSWTQMTGDDSQAQFDALKELAIFADSVWADRERLREERDRIEGLHSNQMRNATADMAEIDRLKAQVSNLTAAQQTVTDALATYKDRVREVALEAKRENSWCDEGFEEAMRRLDIEVTRTVSMTFRVSDFDLREVEVPAGTGITERGNDLSRALGRVIEQAVRGFWDGGTNIEVSDTECVSWDAS